MSITISDKYFKLEKIATEALLAMHTKIPNNLSDKDYGFIIARINLGLAHSIVKILPLEEKK